MLWNNRKSHSLLGMKNDKATLGDRLAVSYKTKHTFAMQPSNHAPWYLPKGLEKLIATENPTRGCLQHFYA